MPFSFPAVPAASAVRGCLPVVACLAVLAGCATYTPKPLDPAAQHAGFESRRLTTLEVRHALETALGMPVATWPPARWDFPTLAAVALHFQPEVGVAQARRRVAEASITTAGMRPNPTASALLQRNRDAPPGRSPWTYDFGLDLPIETAGKRDDRIERSRRLAQAAALREAEVRWQVRSRVRAAFLAAYPTEAPLERQRNLQAQLTILLERRLGAGYASRPEVTQAHLALQQATLALEETKRRRAEGLAQLAAAVGVPVRALQAVALSFDDFARTPPLADLPAEEVRRQALLNLPDVLAALAEYEASQSALQLEVARQYPDIALGPGYSWDAGEVKWSLGLSLVLPLFNRNEGPIAEAEAKREEAAATFRAAQAKAIAEVEEALAGYGHGLRLLETAEQLLHAQRSRERAADAAFRAGETDRLTWLSAQYETASAEAAHTNALLQAQLAQGKLEDALRGPLDAQSLAPAPQSHRNGTQP